MRVLLFFLTFVLANALAQADGSVEALVRDVVAADSAKVFNTRRIDAHRPDVLAKEAVIELMGPAQSTVNHEDPLPLLDTCRLQSCDEKLGAIVDPVKRVILGAALRHYRCHYVNNGEKEAVGRIARSPIECDKTATNTIYIVRRDSSPESLLTEQETLRRLKEWAASKGEGHDELNLLIVH